MSAILDSLTMHEKAKLITEILKGLGESGWLKQCAIVSYGGTDKKISPHNLSSNRYTTIKSNTFDILRCLYEK